MARWLSPGNPDAFVARMDFREGGRHFYGSPSPDGAMMYGMVTYREIVRPVRVVHIQSFADTDGNIAAHPLAPTWPHEMLATTEFQGMGDGTTRLSVTRVPLNATGVEAATFDGARGGMQGGWDHQFGRIEACLAGCDRRSSTLTGFLAGLTGA